MQVFDGETEIIHNGKGEKGSLKYQIKRCWSSCSSWIMYHVRLGLIIYPPCKDQPASWRKTLQTENYITENGPSLWMEQSTMMTDWLCAIWKWLQMQSLDGANVKGYFIWSPWMSFWSNGCYEKRYGLFYVDFETQERYPKKSATCTKPAETQLITIKIPRYKGIFMVLIKRMVVCSTLFKSPDSV